ncbi:MAG: hypothetical protein ACK5P5_01530 [Pseudobdellovibrionaceae bacterium]
MNKLLSTFFLLFTIQAAAAPAPLMSSQLVNSKANVFLKMRGYEINLENLDWNLNATRFPALAETSEASETTDDISLLSNLNQKMTISIQKLKKSTKIDLFTQRHDKEYTQFGFEILGNKKITLGNKDLILIDLYHRLQNKSVRQAIIGNEINAKSHRIAILSCEFKSKDDSADSAMSIKNCNEIIERFSFVQE